MKNISYALLCQESEMESEARSAASSLADWIFILQTSLTKKHYKKISQGYEASLVGQEWWVGAPQQEPFKSATFAPQAHTGF